MPVAVMAAAGGSSAHAHRKLLEQCETQELEAPGGIATPPVYAQLLALYLLHNDMTDATRRRAFGLVSQAYTSISADDFAAFVGLPVEEAVKGVLEQGWQADSSTRMVMPKKPGPQEPSFNRFHPLSEPAPVPPIPNEQQLARLTDYVAFLEN
ncbi:PREDICTED: COP9 signalosome complex subunit 8 [Gekko japonicus]|uniref:COP9 signalosome complex subunit 8 n=1 Tax=Gekko japonicus TaxID=146911 RepID=A0ABM1K2F9_GEKJA|nr:PREDICTED: COP9 signalosome complex subunit 8 [Gekko japonicus]